MARRRLTRAESQEQTRERLLEAAAHVFAEKGFAAASVEEITERAGYTRGAFYSNFGDKDELFLAVLDDRLGRSIEEVSAIVEGASTPGELLAGLRQRAARRPPDRRWVLLRTEFRLYAMRRPAARRRLAALARREQRALAAAVRAQYEGAGLSAPAAPELLALILRVLDHGMVEERLLDPEGVDRDAFFQALGLLMEAGTALARTRPAAALPTDR